MAQKIFTAYSGSDPFLFVSYSHIDDALAFPELIRLNELGYNVWYDEGIDVGVPWSDAIAQRVIDCSLVIYLVTPNSTLSRHCRNEIHYALELEKPILSLYLRPATLPPGMSMRLDLIQGIKKFEYSEERYVEKLNEYLKQSQEKVDQKQPDSTLPRLPMGFVTLMRVEFSSSLSSVSEDAEKFVEISMQWQSLMTAIVAEYSGLEVELTGEFCLFAFKDPNDALTASIGAQRIWSDESSRMADSLKIRVALHSGQPRLTNEKYYGVDVLRLAKIVSIGRGGQTILSSEVREHIDTDLMPENVVFRDIGTHRIRDLPYPEALFDLLIPGLEIEFDPLLSLTNRPNNLPSLQSSFVGRNKEIKDSAKIIRDMEARLLTLTGPGGMGKTRLSIELAKDLAEDFEDGVFVVYLAAIVDAELIIPTIAESLRIVTCVGQTPKQSLIKYLSSKKVLLVLDNFEQVTHGAQELLDLVNDCPMTSLIVSSREPLELSMEREFPVEPLTLPATGYSDNIESLLEIESIKLFVNRVQDNRPEFELTEENFEDIVRLCIRLEGLPLAIELAASRVNTLSLRQLSEKLESDFSILKSRSRDLPDRQRTLATTVKWSYDLLDGDEQDLFAKLSICRGGFSLSAAQHLTANKYNENDLIDGIESLVRKNLLKQDLDYVEARYWMLETIRDFGFNSLLESSEYDDICLKHQEYYLAHTEFLAPGLITNQQRHSVTLLMLDADNIRLAMSQAIESDNPAVATRFFKSLLWLWAPRGYFTEGKEWISKATKKFKVNGTPLEISSIKEISGWLDILGGNYSEAKPKLEQSLEAFLESGEKEDIARTKVALGITNTVLDAASGLELSKEGLSLFRELNDDYGIGLGLVTIGVAHMMRGEVSLASEIYEEALGLFKKLGNTYWSGQLLQNLAHFRLHENDSKSAVNLLQEAFDISKEYDYPIVRNLSIAAMGGVAAVRQQPIEAAKLFGAVRADLDRLGVDFEPPDLAEMEAYLGSIEEQLSEAQFENAFNEGMLWSEKDTLEAVHSLLEHE